MFCLTVLSQLLFFFNLREEAGLMSLLDFLCFYHLLKPETAYTVCHTY